MKVVILCGGIGSRLSEETKIIPGHGTPSTKKELEAYVGVLENIRTNILNAIEAGKTLEEVKTATDISSEYDDTYGGGFIKPDVMRETFYKSLKNN